MDAAKPLVVSCGTGVTACVVALALDQLPEKPQVHSQDPSHRNVPETHVCHYDKHSRRVWRLNDLHSIAETVASIASGPIVVIELTLGLRVRTTSLLRWTPGRVAAQAPTIANGIRDSRLRVCRHEPDLRFAASLLPVLLSRWRCMMAPGQSGVHEKTCRRRRAKPDGRRSTDTN